MSKGIRYTGLIEGNLLKRKDLTNSSETVHSSLGQNYRLGFKGNVIDPQFLCYFIGSTFTNIKSDYGTFHSVERNFGYYDIAVRLFPEKKHSFRFFSKRNKIQSLFDNYDDFNGYSTRTGLRWQFIGKRYPTMSFSVQRYRFKAMKSDKTNTLTEFNLNQQHGNMSHIRLNYKGNLETNNLTGSKTSYIDLRFDGKSNIGKTCRILNYSSYYSRKFFKLYRSNIRFDFNYGKKNNAQAFFKFLGQNSLNSLLLTNRFHFRMRRELKTGLTLQSNLGAQNFSWKGKDSISRQNSANANVGVVFQKYWILKWTKLGFNFDSNLNYQAMSSKKGEGFTMNGARFEFQMGNYQIIHFAGGTAVTAQLNSRENSHIFSFSYNGDIFFGFIPRLTLRSRFNQRFSGGDIYQNNKMTTEQYLPSPQEETYILINAKYQKVTKWDTEVRLSLLRSLYISAGYEINDRRDEIQNTSMTARAFLTYIPTRNIKMRTTFHHSSYLQFNYVSYWLDSKLEYNYRKLTISMEYTDRFSESFYMNRSKTFKVRIKRPLGDESPWGEEYTPAGRNH